MSAPHWDRAARGMPLVIGHRGASALEPENSEAAFRRAAADGADGVELDALCCATGEVLVFHDDDLQRLAGRPQRARALPYAELRTVRLLSGAEIPTLDQALEACGPRMLVNIEIKAEGAWDPSLPRLIEGVAAAVERHGARERVLASSFHPLAVRRWLRRMPSVRAGLLFEASAPRPLSRAWALSWLHPFAAHPEQSLCTPAAVARWHAAGYAVNTWTVDDPSRLRALAAMGLDGVISNDPARARAALAAAG